MIIGVVKQYIYFLLTAGVAIIGTVFLTSNARSLDVAPLSDSHKARIVSNCTSAKASLQQLHRSDASLRVNRGQLYESISTKLMARLNSRIALNRLDGSELVAATVRYEQGLSNFRNNYQAYEEQLTALLRINCQKQPEQFYLQVLDVRERRKAVAWTIGELNRYTAEYYQIFERFAGGYRVTTDTEAES